MPDPTLPPLTTRLPAVPPRWGFWKGLIAGSVIEVPAIATGVWLLGRIGIANGDVGFMRLVRISAVFAGIAAVFTAGGIGRVAAFASVDAIGGRRHAMYKAARAHAAAGAGLVLIATIPHGHLPGYSLKWLVILIVGAGIGWCCGALIGIVCGGAAPVGIGRGIVPAVVAD